MKSAIWTILPSTSAIATPTLVTADRLIVASPEQDKARARRPDLLIAFNVSPQDYRQSNGYISSEQGKPPDFVMEVASITTAETDTGEKRDYYASMGIPEYWRFDETGQHFTASDWRETAWPETPTFPSP